MIELLKESEWHKLEPIFEREWNACLPNPDHAAILVETEDDELIGFCVVETLVRPGMFYVAPNHRGNGTVKRLINRVKEIAAKSKRSFIAIADEPRFEGLFRSLKMRPVGMTFRKDFF